VLSVGIARMAAMSERLPRMQWWVGEVRSGSAVFTVTLMLYGDAALTVVSLDWPRATDTPQSQSDEVPLRSSVSGHAKSPAAGLSGSRYRH
jgi:hypothetical protein